MTCMALYCDSVNYKKAKAQIIIIDINRKESKDKKKNKSEKEGVSYQKVKNSIENASKEGGMMWRKGKHVEMGGGPEALDSTLIK
jgi:predicted transcriptional regulator